MTVEVCSRGIRTTYLVISLMLRCVISVWQNNLDPVLAKILIKERENYAQLANYGTDYFEVGLCYPLYGGKQTSVLRNG